MAADNYYSEEFDRQMSKATKRLKLEQAIYDSDLSKINKVEILRLMRTKDTSK